MEATSRQKLKLLVTVVERGKGDDVSRLLIGRGHYVHFLCLGSGTAQSNILDLLGISDLRKDIVFSFVPEDDAHASLLALNEALQLELPGGGIAFSLPISSVAGLRTYNILASHKDGKDGNV